MLGILGTVCTFRFPATGTRKWYYHHCISKLNAALRNQLVWVTTKGKCYCIAAVGHLHSSCDHRDAQESRLRRGNHMKVDPRSTSHEASDESASNTPSQRHCSGGTNISFESSSFQLWTVRPPGRTPNGSITAPRAPTHFNGFPFYGLLFCILICALLTLFACIERLFDSCQVYVMRSINIRDLHHYEVFHVECPVEFIPSRS